MVGLLADDLHEHRAGDVIAGPGILDDEILFILHHGGEIRQRDISADPAMVKSALVVLLDGDRVLRLGHGGKAIGFQAADARIGATPKLRIFIAARQGFVRLRRGFRPAVAFLRAKPYFLSIEVGGGNLYRGADHLKDSGGLAKRRLEQRKLSRAIVPRP
jgi:hypothetical protein